MHEQIDVDTQNMVDKEVKGLFSDDEDNSDKEEKIDDVKQDAKSDYSSN